MLARDLAQQLIDLDQVEPGIEVRVVVEQHTKKYVVNVVTVERFVVPKAQTGLPKGPKAGVQVRIPRHIDQHRARK